MMMGMEETLGKDIWKRRWRRLCGNNGEGGAV